MKHVPVRLEHVDLLDARDGVAVDLLQGRLELLVVNDGHAVDDLLLATGRALAADADFPLELLQLLGVHCWIGKYTYVQNKAEI